MSSAQSSAPQVVFKRRKRWTSLTNQVFVAMILGAFCGYLFPSLSIEMKPLADVVIRLIKAAIGPIVFLTVVCGIARAGDLRKAGIIGLKALIYFEIVTTFALVLGMLVAKIIRPGDGINIAELAASATIPRSTQNSSGMTNWIEIVPDNVVNSFATGNLIQIIIFAALFGIALSLLKNTAEPVLVLFDRLSAAFFGVVSIIMRLSPLAAFGAMAFAVGRYGAGSLVVLGKLVLTMYATMAFFVFVILGMIARWSGFSLMRLLKYTKSELLLVVGTSSSEVVLPSLMEKLEKIGCHKSVVGLVMPTGYSFNQDGSAIYLTMSVLFIAQVYAIDLTFAQQIGIILVLMLTSKGAAGVSGSNYVILAATVASTNLVPVEGVALLLGVERFLSIGRALLTSIGNLVATMVIAKSVDLFDRDLAMIEYRVKFDDPHITRI